MWVPGFGAGYGLSAGFPLVAGSLLVMLPEKFCPVRLVLLLVGAGLVVTRTGEFGG